MKKTTKGCLIGAGAVAALLLCAPLLIGLMFSITSRLQYNADEPHRATHLAVNDADIALTLWVKQKPRAICYEGDYRVLEVERTGQASEFYTLVPRLAGDDPGLEAFWFPTRQLIRAVDVQKAKGFDLQESVIDLGNHTITHVQREANGDVFASAALRPSVNLVFPPYGAKWSFGRVDSTDPAMCQSYRGRGEYEWVLVRSQEPERVAPTGGVSVGMLEPKRANEDGQPPVSADPIGRVTAEP